MIILNDIYEGFLTPEGVLDYLDTIGAMPIESFKVIRFRNSYYAVAIEKDDMNKQVVIGKKYIWYKNDEGYFVCEEAEHFTLSYQIEKNLWVSFSDGVARDMQVMDPQLKLYHIANGELSLCNNPVNCYFVLLGVTFCDVFYTKPQLANYAAKYFSKKTLEKLDKYLYENKDYLVVEINPFRLQVKIEKGKESIVTSFKSIQQRGWIVAYTIDQVEACNVNLSGAHFNHRLLIKINKNVQEVLQVLEDNRLWVNYCIKQFEYMDQLLEEENLEKEQIETLRLLRRSKESAIDAIENINRYICYSAMTYLCAVVNDFLFNLQEDVKHMIEKNYRDLEGADEFLKNGRFNFISFCVLLDVDERSELWDRWKEFVATRNIIIHNSGIINEAYLNLSKEWARGEEGDTVEVNRAYVEKSIHRIKRMIVQIENVIEERIVRIKR